MLHSGRRGGAAVASEPPGPEARSGRRPVLWDVASTVVVWAAGAAVFFRAQLSSGFSRVMGNDGDTRLIIYLCEHWYQLFRGRGVWLSPAFFYPLKGLLGWSDSFFLYEIFYAPLRLVGCDPFLAFQLTLVALSAVGFGTFVLLVRQALGATHPVALLGGLIFTFSNTLWLHVSSPQLLGVYFVPLILLLGLWSWRALPVHPRRAVVLGATAGLTWALLFYTTYYVAWFLALGGGVAIVVLALGGRRAFIVAAAAGLRRAWRPLVGALAGFGAGIVPFALTYLPVLSQFGGLSYREAMRYAPHWRGMADIGPGNFLWGGLEARLSTHGELTAYEVTFGLTPVLLGLALAGGLVAAWRLARGTAARPRVARAAAVLAAVAVVLVVLPVRTGHGSLWAVVWHIPGATAIRAIDRLQVVTGLAVTLAVVAAATELSAGTGLLRHGSRRGSGRWRLVGVGLLLLAVAEQFNTTQESVIDRPAQLDLLRRAAPPPVSCRSFFVIDSRDGSLPYYVYQIDAMLISQELSVPTVNGYTAHAPRGWSLNRPGQAGYRKDVAAWAAAHHVTSGLCQLDLATMRWRPAPGLPRPGLRR